jgi:hypothetical protein
MEGDPTKTNNSPLEEKKKALMEKMENKEEAKVLPASDFNTPEKQRDVENKIGKLQAEIQQLFSETHHKEEPLSLEEAHLISENLNDPELQKMAEELSITQKQLLSAIFSVFPPHTKAFVEKNLELLLSGQNSGSGQEDFLIGKLQKERDLLVQTIIKEAEQLTFSGRFKIKQLVEKSFSKAISDAEKAKDLDRVSLLMSRRGKALHPFGSR